MMAGKRLIQPYKDIPNLVNFQFWGSPVLRATTDQNATGIKAGDLWCPGFIGPTFVPQDSYGFLGITMPGPTTQELSQVNGFPGIADVRVSAQRKVDMKKASGADGATVTFTGRDPAQVDISLTIWTPQQLKILEAMWKELQPPAGKGEPAAYQVTHPLLRFHSIKALMFVGADGPSPGGPPQSRTFVIRALEYLPPKKKKATKTPKKTETRGSVLDEGAYQPPGKNPNNVGP